MSIKNLKKYIFIASLLGLTSCHKQERSCTMFKTGTFQFTATINGEQKTTRFYRNDTIEIDYFEGKSDTSSVKWINDCEYIVKKINPKNRAEQKAIHMKILITTDTTYTFEYGIVGSPNKQRGTVKKIN